VLGIIIPVHAADGALEAYTLQTLRSIRTKSPYKVYIVGGWTSPVECPHEVIAPQASVAAGWNSGLGAALADGCDVLLVANNDIVFRPDCIDQLVQFGMNAKDVDLWSAHELTGMSDQECDFSCFCLRPETIQEFGWFDESFVPAYREDSDYFARVCLGGGLCQKVRAARFFHYGAMTSLLTGLDRARLLALSTAFYEKKWGTSEISHSRRHVLATHFKHPFDDGSVSLKETYFAPYLFLESCYDYVCRTPSDINEHCPTLYLMARQCSQVTEFGTGNGNSTIALLHAQRRKFVTYDRTIRPHVKCLRAVAGRTDFEVREADVLLIDMERTDMLFIDTFHSYEQLSKELALHADKVSSYIVLHDTITFGQMGEDNGKGIWPAVEDLLARGEFAVANHYENNNGLTVLRRAGG
jgi:hypothetical protein